MPLQFVQDEANTPNANIDQTRTKRTILTLRKLLTEIPPEIICHPAVLKRLPKSKSGASYRDDSKIPINTEEAIKLAHGLARQSARMSDPTVADHSHGFCPVLHEDNELEVEDDIEDLEEHFEDRACLLCRASGTEYQTLDWRNETVSIFLEVILECFDYALVSHEITNLQFGQLIKTTRPNTSNEPEKDFRDLANKFKETFISGRGHSLHAWYKLLHDNSPTPADLPDLLPIQAAERNTNRATLDILPPQSPLGSTPEPAPAAPVARIEPKIRITKPRAKKYSRMSPY